MCVPVIAFGRQFAWKRSSQVVCWQYWTAVCSTRALLSAAWVVYFQWLALVCPFAASYLGQYQLEANANYAVFIPQGRRNEQLTIMLRLDGSCGSLRIVLDEHTRGAIRLGAANKYGVGCEERLRLQPSGCPNLRNRVAKLPGGELHLAAGLDWTYDLGGWLRSQHRLGHLHTLALLLLLPVRILGDFLHDLLAPHHLMHFLGLLLRHCVAGRGRMRWQYIRLRTNNPQLAEHQGLLVLRCWDCWYCCVSRKGSYINLKK